jgi:hypothetical protein
MTVQELKKIIDRLVNSGRGEFEVKDAPYRARIDEEHVDVDEERKTVYLG